MITIELNERQKFIIDIVKNNQPITSKDIAQKLDLTRSTIRPDLSVLTMAGILDARPRVGYFYTGRTRLTYVSDEIASIIVEDVKSVPVILSEDTSIYDAIVFMFLEDVGSIYITNSGYLTGVISRKDIIKYAMGGSDLKEAPVAIIMTRMPNLITVKNSDTLLSAARKLINHQIDSLPVIDIINEEENKYKVVGRVTKTTVTRLFVDLGEEE